MVILGLVKDNGLVSCVQITVYINIYLMGEIDKHEMSLQPGLTHYLRLIDFLFIYL